MGSRCFIAHISPDGKGRAIYCHNGAAPDENGLTLLEHYQDEPAALDLINLGSISRLLPTPLETRAFAYHKDPAHPFCGGTEGFFGRFWTQGTEFLYAWTPDGWFAAPGHRKIPLDLAYDFDADRATDPRWLALDRQAAITQRPRPLATLIADYQARTGIAAA